MSCFKKRLFICLKSIERYPFTFQSCQQIICWQENLYVIYNSPISRESVIPTSTVGQQIDKIADTALQILSERIKENHKRRPHTFLEPVHKVITPILLNRETTK